jgi:hypothetical protein
VALEQKPGDPLRIAIMAVVLTGISLPVDVSLGDSSYGDIVTGDVPSGHIHHNKSYRG